jgi:hypothetical protein
MDRYIFWQPRCIHSRIVSAGCGEHRQAAGAAEKQVTRPPLPAAVVAREAEENWGRLKLAFYLRRTSIPSTFPPHEADLIKSALSQGR